MIGNRSLFVTLIAYSVASLAAEPATLRATHTLGCEGIPANASGNISVEGSVLTFRSTSGSAIQINTNDIHNVTLGLQDKQVGGVPMTLTRAAVPFGGGRVIALFSHKKFDTLTLEYRDANGGFHGAIFQLNKGDGQVLEDELTAAGVSK